MNNLVEEGVAEDQSVLVETKVVEILKIHPEHRKVAQVGNVIITEV